MAEDTSSAPGGTDSGSGSVTSPSTPASASSGVTQEAPSSAPPGEAYDFSSIFEGGGMESAPPSGAEAPVATPTPPPVAPSAPAQPSTPPVGAEAPAPAAVQPSAAPQPTPSAPVGSAPQTQPVAEPPAVDPYDPAALSRYLTQNEAQAIDYMSQNMFRLSPQEIEGLETNASEAIPRLLARVFVKQQQYVLNQMGQMLPTMIQRHSEALRRNEGNENKFYSRWPDVKRDQHGDSVRKYAAVYRQMHPQATLEQMIEDLGPMIMMAHKIVPGVVSNAGGRPAASNGRSPPSPPFVPAGAGPVSASKPATMEPWEAIFAHQQE